MTEPVPAWRITDEFGANMVIDVEAGFEGGLQILVPEKVFGKPQMDDMIRAAIKARREAEDAANTSGEIG